MMADEIEKVFSLSPEIKEAIAGQQIGGSVCLERGFKHSAYKLDALPNSWRAVYKFSLSPVGKKMTDCIPFLVGLIEFLK
ncbi:MAG: hypothetical protein Q9M40_01455 [Sulfurimonas sp.]|nr:hypothetical protein [Sulfurimonas sp.]